jgi:uncharacterized protein YyaL (SSP411 family)
MLNNVKDSSLQYGSGYSNWLQLMSNFVGDYYEIAISGDEAIDKLKEINQQYIPNKLLAGSASKSNIPLMEGRFNENETLIYVCVDGACKLPVRSTEDALNQLKINY